MFTTASDFWTAKTTWLGISAVGAAVIGFFAHKIDAVTAWEAVVAGLALIATRDALVKGDELVAHNVSRNTSGQLPVNMKQMKEIKRSNKEIGR